MTQIANDVTVSFADRFGLEKLQYWVGSIAQLMLRLAIAVPFFKSGLTKWDGFLHLSDATVSLFSDEFKLHLFGDEYAYPAPYLMAFISGCMEITMPILLVLGLGTRFAALAILGMTALIQITVPDGWANFHLIWASAALAILVYGPGFFSLDAIIWRLFGRTLFERFTKS